VLVYGSTDEYDEDFHDDCTCTVNARHFPTKGRLRHRKEHLVVPEPDTLINMIEGASP
jgi:hypothetical protein